LKRKLWLIAGVTLALCGLIAWYATDRRSTFTKEKWRDCGRTSEATTAAREQ
jgi:hypothetical protein